MPCLIAKPVVDGIERSLGERAIVLRIPISSDIGQTLAARLGVRGIPTLIVYDASGQEVLRQVGTLRKDAVLAALNF